MDSRIALVTWEFFIRLLKRLRYDVFDVWLHEGLKLMKRVTECSGHNKDCSRALPPPETTGFAPVALKATIPRNGAEKAFIELLGSEHELDEKRQKRAEARAKRREEIDKAMSENPPPDGSGSDTNA
jgi:hypothetical protein